MVVSGKCPGARSAAGQPCPEISGGADRDIEVRWTPKMKRAGINGSPPSSCTQQERKHYRPIGLRKPHKNRNPGSRTTTPVPRRRAWRIVTLRGAGVGCPRPSAFLATPRPLAGTSERPKLLPPRESGGGGGQDARRSRALTIQRISGRSTKRRIKTAFSEAR